MPIERTGIAVAFIFLFLLLCSYCAIRYCCPHRGPDNVSTAMEKSLLKLSLHCM